MSGSAINDLTTDSDDQMNVGVGEISDDRDPSAISEHFDEVAGSIKWFDDIKGYGFIEADDESQRQQGDILVHFSILKEHDRGSLPEGTKVTCLSANRPKGRQAVKILAFDLSTAVEKNDAEPQLVIDDDKYSEEDFVDVTVKWFNKVRGYGFVNQGEGGQDIFIHMEVLRHYKMDILVPGQTLSVAVEDGERGLMVSAISVK